MKKFQDRGHIDAEDVDGRPIRIVYHNEDAKRTEKIIKAEMEVLKEFAAAYTRGEADDMGFLPARHCRPCEVIVVTSSMHSSAATPGSRKHISVEVATNVMWNPNWPMRGEPSKSKGGVHVYSKNDDLTKGYDGWHKDGRGLTTIRTVASGLIRPRMEALHNNFADPAPYQPLRGPTPPPEGYVYGITFREGN